MNATERIESGISIRESRIKSWLNERGFKGEYLLVSTKPELSYYKKLVSLPEETKLIVDLYTPLLLEKELTFSKWKPQDWLTRWRNKQMVRKFLTRGDHFLVANRRQREYWLKTANDLGVPLRMNDISVFPTGSGNKFAINDLRLTINDSRVVLWFGGVYPWMEPRPVVEAFGKLAPKFPDWKLRFLGGWHPETGYKRTYRKVKELCKRNIPEGQLEFIPWQTKNNLGKYFRDVAFAVHLAKQTPEDYYSHRVRLLTLFSAGIPVLTSGRDVISDLAVRLGAAERAGTTIDKPMDRLARSGKRLGGMRKSCQQIEQKFLEQETDINIRLNDSNHLTLIK